MSDIQNILKKHGIVHGLENDQANINSFVKELEECIEYEYRERLRDYVKTTAAVEAVRITQLTLLDELEKKATGGVGLMGDTYIPLSAVWNKRQSLLEKDKE